MLTLHPDQMTLRITKEADFIDWYVNEFMPSELPDYHALFDSEELIEMLKEMIKHGRGQAIHHGFNTPVSHSHFITLMWHIGAAFYQAPEFKAIALAKDQPETERIDAFYQVRDQHWREAKQNANERLWLPEEAVQ
ncbi:MAG: hypothetical protein L3J00_04970 [Thiomicrorhabdus sp.]|nr:hypothetical protein [Thiomicrorhabdus sp.]